MLLNFEDVSGVHDLPGYFTHNDDGGRLGVIRDTESLDASYERYLRNAVLVTFSVLKWPIIFFCSLITVIGMKFLGN